MPETSSKPALRGCFIVFEGIDGCGKTTQLEALYQWLRQKPSSLFSPSAEVPPLLKTREPGATELGKHLRSLLLQTHWETCPPAPSAELLLYAADRAQHVQQVLKPHLNQGGWVLCDRHVDSTVAYQGYGRGLDLALIQDLNGIATDGLRNDLTFWIDVPVMVAQTRLQQRYQKQRSSTNTDPSAQSDRMEANALDFHHRVYEGFATLAAQFPRRIVRIDGDRDPETIALEIQGLMGEWVGGRGENHYLI